MELQQRSACLQHARQLQCGALAHHKCVQRNARRYLQALAHSDTPPDHAAGPAAPALQPSTSLRVSQRIAAARAAETRRHQRAEERPAGTTQTADASLFLDPYAALLAGWPADQAAAAELTEEAAALDVVATAHLDRLLLNATAAAAVNRITQGDYRQVVLLGDAMDTRPFRLPLPPGIAIYVVAPAEAHAAAQAALASEQAAAIAQAVAAEAEAQARARGVPASRLGSGLGSSAPEVEAGTRQDAERRASGEAASAAQSAAGEGAAGPGAEARPQPRPRSRAARPQGVRPPPGCIVRRVALDLQTDSCSLPSALAAAGFRADRLSVWAVQGLTGLGLAQQAVVALLAEAANCAAYHSLLVGELPPMGSSQAQNALAECGLLGAPIAFGTPDTSYGRWRPEWGPPSDPQSPQRWLFAAQQIRLSAAQMETYTAHAAIAEELDEDFFGNFS